MWKKEIHSSTGLVRHCEKAHSADEAIYSLTDCFAPLHGARNDGEDGRS